jgi:hypothetical protein
LGVGSAVKLVKVDIKGADTAAIAQKIQQAMTANPASFYVVNMSFVLLPCQNVKDLAGFEKQLKDARKAKDNTKYKTTLQNAAKFYDQAVHAANLKKFQKQKGVDPLQDFFADNSATVIPVASAGNFGLDYPFWPAAWSQVISVSGSVGGGFHAGKSWDKKNNTPLLGADVEEKGKKGTRISNFGEVMLPGEYASADYGTLLGTSFAAPRLSLALALYAANTGNVACRRGDGVVALAYKDWKNLSLSEAAQGYCADMGGYLP